MNLELMIRFRRRTLLIAVAFMAISARVIVLAYRLSDASTSSLQTNDASEAIFVSVGFLTILCFAGLVSCKMIANYWQYQAAIAEWLKFESDEEQTLSRSQSS